MMKKYYKNNGITLVALVITVIVLIILAGVGISLALNDNGIATKAREGTQNYQNSSKEEQNMINSISDYIEDSLASEVGLYRSQGIFVTGQAKKISADGGKEITIPVGFRISKDSATSVENGIVIEDGNGNQFVWIPVDNINSYARKQFMGENINEIYTDTLDNNEKNSVEVNKGFYIGRFEAGDSTIPTSSNSELRNENSGASNQVTIKRGFAPYNYVT